jgi:hypothetical protein
MDALSEYLAHLMAFVRLNNMEYALWAAPKYEKTDPFRLAGLRAALDVEIARFTEKRKCLTTTTP